MSADQIADGIDEGGQILPYLIYTDISLPELDAVFKSANSPVTLEDTYVSAYQRTMKDVPLNGNTGQVFEDMRTASRFLQQILRSKGVDHFENYFMTAIGTAQQNGYILLATVYRPEISIQVFNKFDFLQRQTLTPEDMEFYRAYRTDVAGRDLDTIIDWMALPVNCISTQKRQAILLTLTANKIIERSSVDDYWKKERHWIAGEYLSVLGKQDLMLCRRLGLEECFYQHMND